MLRLLAVAVAVTRASSVLASSLVIAHSGIHNPFSVTDYNCGTRRLSHTRYPYIEGTRASIEKAFLVGADIVEIDLRVTADRKVVLFHDEDVSCRTEGQGKVRDLSLAQLKSLDLAYFLSSDDGKTFPLRGLGKRELLTLAEVWKFFPGKRFMLNPKDQDIASFSVLKSEMAKLDLSQGFLYWGNGAGYAMLDKAFPGKGWFIPNHFQQVMCLDRLVQGIWFGYFPPECRHRTIDLSPEQWRLPYMPLLLKLAKHANARVVLFGVNDRRSFIGFMDQVDAIISSELLEVGSRYSPAI